MPTKGTTPDRAAEGVSDNGTFKLGDFAVDEYRPIRVIVIGAGFSGILAGIRYLLTPLPFSRPKS